MSFCMNNNIDKRSCNMGNMDTLEKTCIQVKKVFDACMKQQTRENVILAIDGCVDITKLTFVSAKSSGAPTIKNLSYEEIKCQGNLNRVTLDVVMPMEVVLVDDCKDYTFEGSITEHFDVIMNLPTASIIPFEIVAVASCICPNGKVSSSSEITVTACETIILKVVAESELIIPSYGYYEIPPCQDYSEEVCSGFFELPLYPNQQNCK